MIVCKFGGTSLADADHIRQSCSIVQADSERRFVVVSAPGKRFPADEKVTDLLLLCHELQSEGKDFSEPFETLRTRFSEIQTGLGLGTTLDGVFSHLYEAIRAGASRDYVASRGEYLCAKIVARYLRFPFINPAQAISFRPDGTPDYDTSVRSLAHLLGKHAYGVIPGFYGTTPDGQIRTFSRGGSDVTGSLVAAAANASLYENWTDVSGLLMADPRIVPDARCIPVVTYRELRELSYMGANVLHEDAVFPVRSRDIPIRICNTLSPEDPGTLIVSDASADAGSLTGIAGKKGLTAVFVEKDRMNAEIGFGRRVLSVLEERGICFEHLPSGIDTLSVLVESSVLNGVEDEILEAIRNAVRPDRIHLEHELALIAVVGRGMIRSPGSAAKLFAALAKAGINVRMIDQGSSELNIIVGVEEKDYESAIRAVYREFVSA